LEGTLVAAPEIALVRTDMDFSACRFDGFPTSSGLRTEREQQRGRQQGSSSSDLVRASDVHDLPSFVRKTGLLFLHVPFDDPLQEVPRQDLFPNLLSCPDLLPFSFAPNL
jgi:hypothetical protein